MNSTASASAVICGSRNVCWEHNHHECMHMHLSFSRLAWPLPLPFWTRSCKKISSATCARARVAKDEGGEMKPSTHPPT